MRRWGCCDATPIDAAGCCLRSHLPPENDPIYDKVMRKIEERDEEENDLLNENLEIARIANHPFELQKIKQKQVTVAEDLIAKDRAIAAKYTGLD